MHEGQPGISGIRAVAERSRFQARSRRNLGIAAGQEPNQPAASKSGDEDGGSHQDGTPAISPRQSGHTSLSAGCCSLLNPS